MSLSLYMALVIGGALNVGVHFLTSKDSNFAANSYI